MNIMLHESKSTELNWCLPCFLFVLDLFKILVIKAWFIMNNRNF